jgi:hypothetical protein
MLKSLNVAALLVVCAVSPCTARASDDAHFPANEDLRRVRAIAHHSAEPWRGFDGRQRILRFFKTAFGE